MIKRKLHGRLEILTDFCALGKIFSMREDPGNNFNIFSKETENSWSAVVV